MSTKLTPYIDFGMADRISICTKSGNNRTIVRIGREYEIFTSFDPKTSNKQNLHYDRLIAGCAGQIVNKA